MTARPDDVKRRHRRRALWFCGATSAVVLVLAGVAALVLALVVFKPRQLETKLQSADVDGFAPRVAFPEIHVEINVSVSLDFLVSNPNRAAFDHGGGTAAIFYLRRQVADADVAPGRIPPRGSVHLLSRLTVQADRFAADPAGLARDVIAGRLELDSSTRIPGRVSFLGFLHRHVIILIDCHLIISFPPVAVASQHCRQSTA
ncbi:uncharacterized protein LOC144715633 [Wolffia australiana]